MASQDSNSNTLDDSSELEEDSLAPPDTQEQDTIDALAQSLGLEEPQVEQQIIEDEDGSAIINFVETKKPSQDPDFYENLAASFEEDTLFNLAQEYIEYIDSDRESRKERDEQYELGLQRTGLGEPAPGGAEFTGASKVTHPLLTEAVIDFASSSERELLPPDGIVKADIKNNAEKDALAKATRKSQFLNWQLDEQVSEYRSEMSSLLSQLPLGGSQFLKWVWDPQQKRPSCAFLPIDNIYVPPIGSSFYTAQRITEVERITHAVFLQRITQGLYVDIEGITELSTLPDVPLTQTQKAAYKIEGYTEPEKNLDGIRILYHVYTWLELEEDPITKGERAPYILVLDDYTGEILALHRNWAAGDDKYTKLDWIVEFSFISWRGIFGIGLPALIGGLSGASTGALRALLDSAHANNIPALFKAKGVGSSGQTRTPKAGEVLEVEMPVGTDDIRKVYSPIPFNPPSPVLLQLLTFLTEQGKGVVSTSEEKIQDAGNEMAVGTAQALIEQGAKIFSAIHARLHRAQAKSLQILSRLNFWYLPEMDNQSGTKIEVRDFSNNSDIRPVSDPHIFSETQRISQAQAVLALASQAKTPGLYDERAVHKRMLTTLKVPNIEELLPDPKGVVEANPVLENVQMSLGQPCAVFPNQDHIAHIITHLSYYSNPVYGSNPLIAPTFGKLLSAHLKQHFVLHYLQAMKNDVQEVSGEDIFALHEEKPISIRGQQALAFASTLVGEKSFKDLNDFMPYIQDLLKKVQQQAQSQQEQTLRSDPAAAVLLKTEEAKNKLDTQRAKDEYQLKIAELMTRVEELESSVKRDNELDNNKNATQVAIASLNAQNKLEIEQLKGGIAQSQAQMQLDHEQQMLGIQAAQEAQQELQAHGLDLEKTNHQAQIDQAQASLGHEQAMAQGQQQQQGALQQAALAHQQQMAQGAQKHAQTTQAEKAKQQGALQQAALGHEVALAKGDQQAQQAQAQQAHDARQFALGGEVDLAKTQQSNDAKDFSTLSQLATKLYGGPSATPEGQVVSNLTDKEKP